VGVGETNFDLLALDEALTRLAAKEEHLADIVELRFFSGLGVEDTAEFWAFQIQLSNAIGRWQRPASPRIDKIKRQKTRA